MMAGGYPGGRRFAFTIVDDTDGATVANVGPMYELLTELGMRTTKTAWVYPSRDRHTGGTLADGPYVDWIRALMARGFEIALHNVGSGAFTRDEILAGLERFRELLGRYPRIHINHSANPDNFYWRPERRFRTPVRWAYALIRVAQRVLRGRAASTAAGDEPTSPHYWGDALQAHVSYVRNLTFRELNTLKVDPRMPCHDPRKPLVPRWFSSADGNTATHFVDLLAPDALDRLEREGGAAIIYTHFASGFVADGRVVPAVESRLRDLAARPGWFVPASELLDHLGTRPVTAGVPDGYFRRLELRWLVERVGNFLRYRR